MSIEGSPFPTPGPRDDLYVFISNLFVNILFCQVIVDNEGLNRTSYSCSSAAVASNLSQKVHSQIRNQLN